MKIADSAICSAEKFLVFLSTLAGAGVGVGTLAVRSCALTKTPPELGARAMTPMMNAQKMAGAIKSRNKNSVLPENVDLRRLRGKRFVGGGFYHKQMLKGVEGQARLLTTELCIKSLNSSAAGEIGQSIDAVYFAIGCL